MWLTLSKEVLIKREVINSILTYAKIFHPRESILLLRGRKDKNRIILDEVVIPPLSTHGNSFSSFPINMLPIDFSIMGTAHSHPSGVLRPSIEDLNKFYGRLMLITSYPYDSDKDLAVFSRGGTPVNYGTFE